MTDQRADTLDGITQAWVASAQDGDAANFARLYEHIAPAIFTWASLRLRPDQRGVLEPSDLVQEVWLRAWRKIDTFDTQKTRFRYWVFRIAKNVLLEASRQARRPDNRARRATSDGTDPLAAIADSITGVSRRVARDENLERFRAAVLDLPPEERKLVLHCGLEGLPLREAGQRLGISEEAAGKRWQRLRERLRSSELPRFLLDDGPLGR